jgi:hypothetical protein
MVKKSIGWPKCPKNSLRGHQLCVIDLLSISTKCLDAINPVLMTYHQTKPSALDVINPALLINKVDPAINPGTQQHVNVNTLDLDYDPWSGGLT